MKRMQVVQGHNNFKKFTPIAYAIAAAIAISANNPFSVLRFRLQTMPELLRQGQLVTPYSGLFDCAKRILKQQKVRGFWKGNFSVLVRFYPSQLFNFFLKQTFSKLYNSSKLLKETPQFFINCLSGVTSGYVTITLLYPLDYARLKLTNNIRSRKINIWNTIYSTFKLEGLRGIYRGVLLSYFGMSIFRGSFFGVYDTFKVNSKNNFQKFTVSYGAMLISMFLTSPIQTVIRRMMMTSGHQFKYGGYVDCVRQIYRKQKIRGFYRGVTMILFQGIMVALMFTFFDKIFTQLKSTQESPL